MDSSWHRSRIPSPTNAALPVSPGHLIGRTLRSHVWFIGAILVFAVAGEIVPRFYGLEDYIRLSLYLGGGLWVILLAFLIAFMVSHVLYVIIAKRPARLMAHIVRDYQERFLVSRRLANGLLLILILPVFFSVFTTFKIMIPRINPFSWDPTFAQWDQALHGGVAPWRLLHRLLGFPVATQVINFTYHLWFFVLQAVLFWQGFSLANPRLRMQFLLTTVLTWALLGSLAATLLSSAGPCYYGRVIGGADPFAPLMAYLHRTAETHSVPALRVQDLLWAQYQAGGLAQGLGISAMPSMHVSSVFLFVLLSWHYGRMLRWSLIGFFVLILIGSVHLGWHYAIDGYTVVPATWLLWHLAGRLLDFDPLFRDTAGRARLWSGSPS